MNYLQKRVKGRRAFMIWGRAATLAALFALIFGIAGCSSDADYDDADTTSSDYTISGNTYTVYTEAGLLAWNEAAQADTSISCILAKGIDMLGKGWTPVGTEESPYTGTFDGRGHVVSNINIQGDASNATGFVGYLGAGGWVKNLGLKDATVWGKYVYTGAIVGRNCGTVSFCYAIDSDVAGVSTNVGGIVGENAGLVLGCYYTGAVTSLSGSNVGGLAGYNHTGSITSSYAAANSIWGKSNTGGFVGNNGSGTLNNCYWYWDATSNTLNEEIDSISGLGSSNSTSGITEVDGTTTWADAIEEMNNLIARYDWQFVWNEDDTLPYLSNEL